MAARFLSLGTDDYRAYLRQAFLASKNAARSLLDELTLRQLEAMESGGPAGAIKMSSANGHQAMTKDGGIDEAASAEFRRMYENLISRKGSPIGIGVEPATRLLNFAALYGLNPDHLFDCWPDPLPAPIDPAPDPVSDQTVFDFVMKNLVPITSYQNDYIWLRLKPGLQYAS